MMHTTLRLLPCIALLLLLAGCYRTRPSNGGGAKSSLSPSRTADLTAANVALPPGYKIESVAHDFTFPTAVAFDNQNRLHVLEAGYSYGEVWTEPRLLRVEASGARSVVASGTRNGPWNGMVFHEGYFYVAEGGELEGGRLLRIAPDGTTKVLAEELPSMGDHHTNGPAIRDGYLYFGQGTATNSGVVGTDNADFGWLRRHPRFHDIPCQDVVLSGQNYETTNVLTEPATKAQTGAYSAYNTTTYAGQIIKGQVPCSGAVLRVPLAGGAVELVAWGLRNPFGLAFSADGRLYVSENSFDNRGSRPVWGSGDVLWQVQPGTWYGWPDFAAGKPISGDEEFKTPGHDAPRPLLQKYPNQPPRPAAVLGVHSSSCGLDFARGTAFGFEGEAFVAQFGDMAPKVGKVLGPVGFKVVRVDVRTGVVRDFAVNRGKRNGPASAGAAGGLERPVSVRFDPAGTALYIVDFGRVRIGEKATEAVQKSGVIWKVTRQQQ
jgi:glucose/arabinose dehydrogenase